MISPKDRLRDYINHPNASYSMGVALFYDLTGKAGIRDSLLTYPSPKKLKDHLLRLFHQLTDTEESSISPPIAIPINHKAVDTSIPAELQPLEDQRILLFKKLSQSHAYLRAATTNEHRYQYMTECVAIDAEILDLRDRILYYKEYGRFPLRQSIPKPHQCDESKAQIALKLKNIPQSIYADKKKLTQLQASLQVSKDIQEISSINQQIQKVSVRLKEKLTTQKHLRQQLKS